MKEMKECDWLQQWTDLAKRFAFQYNPALQPRAIIVYGCIAKSVSDSEIKQLLRILVKVLGSFSSILNNSSNSFTSGVLCHLSFGAFSV